MEVYNILTCQYWRLRTLSWFIFLHLKIHFPSESALALRFYNSVLQMLDTGYGANIKIFRVHAIGHFYSPGVLCVWKDNLPLCRARRSTKDSSSSFVPLFVLESTTRTMKIAQTHPDGLKNGLHKLYLNSIRQQKKKKGRRSTALLSTDLIWCCSHECNICCCCYCFHWVSSAKNNLIKKSN